MTEISQALLDITYLIASIAFIVGLKMQSSPDTARKGNFVAASGMGLATLATIIFFGVGSDSHFINYAVVFGGLATGAFIGSYLARTVKMTGMPEMVSLLNGFGGATSLLLALNEYLHLANPTNDASLITAGSLVKVSLFLGLLVGGVTFTGSVIAWGKLQGKIKDINLPGQQFINIAMLVGVLMLGGLLVLDTEPNWLVLGAIVAISLIYGYFFVMPIGGADMPVVIALLNSFSGIAAIFAGFLVDNNAMIIGGILVGSSGTILSVMMCNAMNRSLMNVLIGNFGGSSGGNSAAAGDQTHKEVSATDAAIMCNYAQKVIIVPGYGMAVAQAQHAVHGVDKLLEANGVEVLYAIHPVAGRMPGHMNVLLAEADVPYDKLLELEPANEQFKNADVVLIIGANDVVNPAANEEPNSPIYGMPVLNVYEAKNVIVFKRSMKPGYAGIENPLFFRPNTSMLFGDAKAMIDKLGQEIKNL
jgi:H+-translocating NAD(P) transhydrogenase subunit beta